jgi:WD40 repeat protein
LAFQFAEGVVHVGTDRGACVYYDTMKGGWKKADTKLGVEFRALAVSKYGKYSAYGGKAIDNGPSLVIDGEKLQNVTDAVPENEAINGLSFSADGKHLAAACSDGAVRVFEVDGAKLVASAKEHKEPVYSVAYSPDGKKLLTVGRDSIKVWDVEALMKAK